MPEVSRDLGALQVNLSEGNYAHITPKIATDVFASIAYLEDTTPTAMGRRIGVSQKSMCEYCKDTLSCTPNLNKAVHMFKALGYDLYLRKTPEQ